MTVLGGAPVLASDVNEALNRRIGKTESQSDAAGFTTAETVDLVLTVSVLAGRTYEVFAYVPLSSTVAGDEVLVRIRQGSTTGAAQNTYDRVRVHTANGVYIGRPSFEYTAAADGSVTFCITGNRVVGTGTITPKGAAAQPRFIAVRMQTTE